MTPPDAAGDYGGPQTVPVDVKPEDQVQALQRAAPTGDMLRG